MLSKLDARQVGCERHQGAFGDSKLILRLHGSTFAHGKVEAGSNQAGSDWWHVKAIKERKVLRNRHWNSLVSCVSFQMWNKDFARYGYGTRCCNAVRAVRSMLEKEKFRAVREQPPMIVIGHQRRKPTAFVSSPLGLHVGRAVCSGRLGPKAGTLILKSQYRFIKLLATFFAFSCILGSMTTFLARQFGQLDAQKCDLWRSIMCFWLQPFFFCSNVLAHTKLAAMFDVFASLFYETWCCHSGHNVECFLETLKKLECACIATQHNSHIWLILIAAVHTVAMIQGDSINLHIVLTPSMSEELCSWILHSGIAYCI